MAINATNNPTKENIELIVTQLAHQELVQKPTVGIFQIVGNQLSLL